MRLGIGLFVMGVLATCHALATEPADHQQSQKDAAKPQIVLVHLNCSPTDEKALMDTLRVALACCEDKSAVTLFIDLQAVVLAKRETEVLSKQKAALVENMFDKLRVAHAQILVCPHCAGQFGVEANQIRRGTRFTTKEELEDVTKKAYRIFEYKKPENNRTDDGFAPQDKGQSITGSVRL